MIFIRQSSVFTGEVRICVFGEVGPSLGAGARWRVLRAAPLHSAKAGEGRGGSVLKRTF